MCRENKTDMAKRNTHENKAWSLFIYTNDLMRIYTNVVVSKVTNNKQYFILKRIFFYLHKIIKVKHTQPVHLLYHITSVDLTF